MHKPVIRLKRKKNSFRDIEIALKKEIKAVAKVADAGERLLQYKALSESTGKLYDRDVVDKNPAWLSTGAVFGGILGFVAVIAGMAAAGIIVSLSGGLGVVIAGGGVGALVAHFIMPKEIKHAYKMSAREGKINRAIRKLTSKKKNIEKLSRSPHAKDVAGAFPEVKEAFRLNASLKAEREKFLANSAPAAAGAQSMREKSLANSAQTAAIRSAAKSSFSSTR